jgi:hypothetical protein
LLLFSLFLNVALLIGMAAVFARAKRVMLLEKLSTFNACVDAVVLGLVREDREKRVALVAHGLSALCEPQDIDDLELRLVQASQIRRVRNDVSADLLGEYVKFAMIQISKSENYRPDVLEYMMAHEEGMPEPREKFDDATLAGIQFFLQFEISAMYKRKISERRFRLWGGLTDTPFRPNL